VRTKAAKSYRCTAEIKPSISVVPREKAPSSLAFVTTVTTYALRGEDLYALESLQIQSVFTPDELFEFHARVRADLVPNLAEVRAIWQSNHNSEEPADEHIQPLLDSFAALKEEFVDEPTIIGKIDREIERIKEWISDNT
jgi:hypothetical protein